MSDEHYTTGEGHFGDQTGDAGQKKQFVSRASRVHDKTDPIQKALWDQGIMVEVHTCKEDFITGRREIFIVGLEADVNAAISHCKSQKPPIDVVYHKTDAARDA